MEGWMQNRTSYLIVVCAWEIPMHALCLVSLHVLHCFLQYLVLLKSCLLYVCALHDFPHSLLVNNYRYFSS